MSDCGNILVACLAAPLILIVMLVAGIGYLALEGARLVGQGVLKGVEFAGQALPAMVRAANSALSAAGALAVEGVAWAGERFQLAQTGERLRGLAVEAYRSNLQMLQTSPSLVPASLKGVELPHLQPPHHVPPSHLPIGASPIGAGSNHLIPQTDPLRGVGGLARPGQELVAATPPSLGTSPALEESRAALQGVARVRALQAALRAEQPLHLVAQSLFPSHVEKAARLTAQAGSLLEEGHLSRAARVADQAEELYTTVSYDAYQHLRRAERATVAAVVGNTLEDMGYELKVAQGRKGIAFVGRRDHQTLALIARPQGRLELDMAGFHGDSCQTETKALLVGLRRNGLVLSEVDLKRHGCLQGGSLARKAQRQGKSLETVLEEMVKQPADSGPVRRRGRLATDEEQIRRARTWMGLHQSARGGQ